MAQVKGQVKHILHAKFKDEITEEEKEKQIRDFANLQTKIEQIRSFEWGLEVSIEDFDQGFTRIFQLTFDDLEARTAYIKHPAHIEFSNAFVPLLDKIVVVDYVPTPVPVKP